MLKKKPKPRRERRISARADASLSMRLEGRPDEGDLTRIVTESRNISASGVYCTSPHYLAPLSKIALTIVLPSRTPAAGARRLLKCDGVVVRCLPASKARGSAFELACSFLGLEARHRALIDEFVSRRNLENIRPHLAPRRTTRRATTPRAATPRAKATGRATAKPKAAAARTRRASSRRG